MSDDNNSCYDYSTQQSGTSVNVQVSMRHPPQMLSVTPLTLDDSSGISSKRLPGLFLPRQGSVEYQKFEEILRGVKKFCTINDLPYHIKSAVEECLDVEKHDRTDWREVASRLNLKSTFIEQLMDQPPKSPTKKIFEQASNKKVTELLQCLYRMERHDVLDVIYQQIDVVPMDPKGKREQFYTNKLPSQETTPESGSSLTSDFPYKPQTPSPAMSPATPTSPPCKKFVRDGSVDSGRGSTSTSRSRSESNPQQHTDCEKHNLETTVDFHTEDSKTFWRSVPPIPDGTNKEWKQFERVLKEKFPREALNSPLVRLICYVLKIDNFEERHTRYVRDQDFANMVAWFGPFVAGKNGCFDKMTRLITSSVTYKPSTGRHSFFAGHMTKDDADKTITACETGTFLIRFSSTNADQGSFSVVLKTSVGAEHHLIEGNPKTGELTFEGKTYNDLTQLHKSRLCKNGVSCDRRTSCRIICPNLPLNAMFKSYNSGPGSTPSIGRGRGRGKGQDTNS